MMTCLLPTYDVGDHWLFLGGSEMSETRVVGGGWVELLWLR